MAITYLILLFVCKCFDSCICQWTQNNQQNQPRGRERGKKKSNDANRKPRALAHNNTTFGLIITDNCKLNLAWNLNLYVCSLMNHGQRSTCIIIFFGSILLSDRFLLFLHKPQHPMVIEYIDFTLFFLSSAAAAAVASIRFSMCI